MCHSVVRISVLSLFVLRIALGNRDLALSNRISQFCVLVCIFRHFRLPLVLDGSCMLRGFTAIFKYNVSLFVSSIS